MKIGGLQYESNAFYSKQDWQGLYPQKWNGGKLHLKPADTLNSQQQNQNIPFRPPKRPIQPNQSQIYQYKPHNKQFEGLNGKTTEQPQHKYGVKHVQFNPSQKKSRPELRHLSMQKNDHLEDINYGIKTYEHANQTRGQTWNVENQMNKKQRLKHLDDKRNQISCVSLGDKPYKYPENSYDFFKSGGLIPGSSIKARQIKKTSEKQLSSTRVPGKLTWKERVQIDDRQQEQDAVDELDDWVENVLKEANPNYQDPDLFFEKMEQNQEEEQQKGGKGKKDIKKESKKGKK